LFAVIFRVLLFFPSVSSVLERREEIKLAQTASAAAARTRAGRRTNKSVAQRAARARGAQAAASPGGALLQLAAATAERSCLQGRAWERVLPC